MGFSFFKTITPVKAGKPFVTHHVWYGENKEIQLGVVEDTSVTLPKGQVKNLRAIYTLSQPQLLAPLQKNQVVDTIEFQLNGKIIEQRLLVVMETEKQVSLFSRIVDYVMIKVNSWFGKWFP